MSSEALLDQDDSRNPVVAEHSELRYVLILASGILTSRISWVVIKSTDTALLGHVSAEALEATALSDLYTSATGVITFGYVLSVFVANSKGANDPRMGSIWFLVSLVILGFLTCIVMVLWFFTKDVLLWTGARSDLAKDGGYYAAVLALCLPARTLFGQMSQLFSSNDAVRPSAYSSILAALVNLTAGLIFVLGIPFDWDGFGFPACPWVSVAAEYSQLAYFYVYFVVYKQVHKSFWFPVEFSEITKSRVKEYLALYVPAALSSASDWWRVTVIGIFAAKIGNPELAVFNSSYRILWITLTFVGSVAQAIGILVSQNLGSGNSARASKILSSGSMFVVLLLLLLTLVVFLNVEVIASVFTNDEEIQDLFVKIRLPLCVELFFMNFSVFMESLLVSLGKTRTVFYIGAIGSWLGQVPACYLGTYHWHSIEAIFWGISLGYCVTVIGMAISLCRIDWIETVGDARHRGGIGNQNVDEEIQA